MSFIVVYITCRDQTEANRISEVLLSKKFIACSNIFPIQSNFWWEEEIVAEKEYVCLVKTPVSHWEKLKTEVNSIHSYKIPCIMKFEVEANPAYEKWIMESVEE